MQNSKVSTADEINGRDSGGGAGAFAGVQIVNSSPLAFSTKPSSRNKSDPSNVCISSELRRKAVARWMASDGFLQSSNLRISLRAQTPIPSSTIAPSTKDWAMLYPIAFVIKRTRLALALSLVNLRESKKGSQDYCFPGFRLSPHVHAVCMLSYLFVDKSKKSTGIPIYPPSQSRPRGAEIDTRPDPTQP